MSRPIFPKTARELHPTVRQIIQSGVFPKISRNWVQSAMQMARRLREEFGCFAYRILVDYHQGKNRLYDEIIWPKDQNNQHRWEIEEIAIWLLRN